MSVPDYAVLLYNISIILYIGTVYCTWLHTGNFTGTRIGILHESLIMGVCIQEVQTCSNYF